MPVEMKATADAASITMHGDVGWDISTQAVASALKSAAGKPLNININSYGGDAFAGIAIFNMLARHQGKKTVVIDGIAASAASLIAMAGDEIVMPENAFMLIHNASGVAVGTADAAREVADALDAISAAYLRTYVAKTGRPPEEIQALMDADRFMSADEALSLGFATEVSAPADIRMDARRLSVFTNLPAALKAATRPAEPANSKEAPRMSAVSTEPADKPADVPPTAATLVQIKAIAARAQLGSDFVLAQIEAQASEADVTAAALEALAGQVAAAASAKTVDDKARDFPQALAPRTQILRDERETKAALMANALAVRGLVPGATLDDGARQFRGMRLIDMARECLDDAGVKTRGKTPIEIATMAMQRGRFRMAGEHTSGDFPDLLANTASKSLRASYQAAPRTFLPWTTQMNLPDFKTFKTISLGGASQLAEIAESGEVTYGTLDDNAESWALLRYGKALALSYVAIVNDDMSGFTRVPAMMGAAAARKESDVVYAILTANAAMADGVTLFHASHSNSGTGAISVDATGVANIGTIETKLNLQTAPNGEILNLRGRYLVAPVALRTKLFQLFARNVVPATSGAVNPLPYEIITEGRLDATSAVAYYLIADPSTIDTVAYGYLDGTNGPEITSETDFDTDGLKIKVMHNFGAKAIDWRGMAYSTGA